MRLTPHFSLDEMIITQHRSINNTPSQLVIEALTRTAKLLEEVRLLLKCVIIISSGFRCPDLNQAVGGARASRHMLGLAADFICPSFGTPFQICKAIAESDIIFDQLILEFSWVHIGLPLLEEMSRKEILTVMHGGTFVRGLVDH